MQHKSEAVRSYSKTHQQNKAGWLLSESSVIQCACKGDCIYWIAVLTM